MRKIGALLLALLLSLAFPFHPVGAAEGERRSSGKLRALLIGCDHFLTQEDTWPAAENNVKMLSDTLLADQRRYALVRTYAGSISSVSDFEEAVLSAFQSAGEEDTSLLYIATHGVFEEGVSNAEAGLLLSDGQREELLDAPSLQRVLSRVAGMKVVILDACNSGAIIGKGLSGGADRLFLTGPEYKVICSAGGSEASWYFHSAVSDTTEGASYFATVLCQGLGMLGDYAADSNMDGQVTLEEACLYLRDNYAVSTPQAYPESDREFVLFSYDPLAVHPMRKAITDITFDETLLTAGQTEAVFSFTVQRQVALYYQIIYHQDGAWQFQQAKNYLDGEQADGTVLPGRKERALSLRTDSDASGYVIVQLITLEDGQPVFQGGRLLCVRPAAGAVSLRVLTPSSFLPSAGQELAILAQHDVPCALSVNVLDGDGRLVRRLCYEAPSRPQQLFPAGSTFYWDGRLPSGEAAPPGHYLIQVKTEIGGQSYSAQSLPFELLSPDAEWEVLPPALSSDSP